MQEGPRLLADRASADATRHTEQDDLQGVRHPAADPKLHKIFGVRRDLAGGSARRPITRCDGYYLRGRLALMPITGLRACGSFVLFGPPEAIDKLPDDQPAGKHAQSAP